MELSINQNRAEYKPLDLIGLPYAARYIAPTILRNLPAESKFLQEEIFGPILPVQIVSRWQLDRLLLVNIVVFSFVWQGRTRF